MRKLLFHLFFIILFFACCNETFAQVKEKEDTFFLLKKKGLLKKLGESIYRADEIEVVNPIKIVDPFLEYQGRRIRFISIAPTGFYTIVHDTVDGKKGNFAEGVADFFHKNTLPKVIRKNLFFKEGDKILPLKLSDNERFLRQQPFMEDARIMILPDSTSPFVDVVILTRDVFSLGASVQVTNTKKDEIKGEASIRDENLFGRGDRLEFTGLYDQTRLPAYGFGGSYTKRNLKHSFINWTTGFKNYNAAFNSGRKEENIFYTGFDKPLLSRYNAWTGAAYFAFNTNSNVYNDTSFKNQFKYSSLTTDIWGGINIGYKSKREIDSEKRLRHFVAMRTFYNDFFTVPNAIKDIYDPAYADINGFLMSYSLYKQNFYRTNFIYGFGRNEDVPEGLNATIVGGYINKEGIRRPYYGLEFDGTHFNKKGSFITYTFRSGAFLENKRPEDANILLGINRFTKLMKLNAFWLNRNFFSANFTRQMNTVLSPALYLESNYGLPYFNGTGYGADTRTTLKFETVFYNLKRILGFRLAPFAFTDLSLLKPINEESSKTNGYTAIGGGLRARNENLVFGTIELKGYFFPRVANEEMKNWRVEFTSKLRFNFNTSFIRRPDFVSPN
jgi:hypothetical protein